MLFIGLEAQNPPLVPALELPQLQTDDLEIGRIHARPCHAEPSGQRFLVATVRQIRRQRFDQPRLITPTHFLDRRHDRFLGPCHGQTLQSKVIFKWHAPHERFESVELEREVLAHRKHHRHRQRPVAHDRAELLEKDLVGGAVTLVAKKLLELVEHQHQRRAHEERAHLAELPERRRVASEGTLLEPAGCLERVDDRLLEPGDRLLHPVAMHHRVEVLGLRIAQPRHQGGAQERGLAHAARREEQGQAVRQDLVDEDGALLVAAEEELPLVGLEGTQPRVGIQRSSSVPR